MSDPLRVAAICTIYHPKSHADVIVTKFLKGGSTDNGFVPPEVEVVSMYIDHVLENDIGVGLAAEFGVPIYPSIRRALHAGENKLNVDAVLLIGAHDVHLLGPWAIAALGVLHDLLAASAVDRKIEHRDMHPIVEIEIPEICCIGTSMSR